MMMLVMAYYCPVLYIWTYQGYNTYIQLLLQPHSFMVCNYARLTILLGTCINCHMLCYHSLINPRDHHVHNSIKNDLGGEQEVMHACIYLSFSF